VREVVPAGWIKTTMNPASVIVTNAADGGNFAGGNFGDFQLGQVSGVKFLDRTGDGPTGDDTPLAGIIIKLFRDVNKNGRIDAADGAAVRTTVTGANGSYHFSGLSAGSYLDTESSPKGYVETGTSVYGVLISSGSNVAGKNFYNFKLDQCAVDNVTYSVLENGVTRVYTTLSGHVHSGDVVTVKFNVPAGDTDTVSLASYSAPSWSFTESSASKQTLFNGKTGTFGPGMHTLTVQVPKTFFQIDFVCGYIIPKFGAAGSNIFYSEQQRLLSSANGDVPVK